MDSSFGSLRQIRANVGSPAYNSIWRNSFSPVVLGGFTSITNESESADLTLVMSGVFATGLLFFIGYKILK